MQKREPVTARARATRQPDAIVIAASTGGPQALETLFAGLGNSISHVPVFVALHMPEQFSSYVTSQIEKISGCATLVAVDGEAAQPGRIYFAPGNKHLALQRVGLSIKMQVKDGPSVNFCRPSADILFSSAIDVYGSNLMAIVLSGMGNDGCDGAIGVAGAGGIVIAQDEETSAIWGMPAAVVEAGAAHHVLPIEMIATQAKRLLSMDRQGAAA